MNKTAILEGLLFVMGEDGLSIDDIVEILEVEKEEAIEIISNLRKNYEEENRGLRINFLGNTFKLSTKPEHKEYYQKLIENPNTNTLSQSALETLAIIAYNAPITRATIDDIRGVNTSHMIRKLVAKGFIKEIGKSDSVGRPNLYETTNEFLDYFGLKSIDELPALKEVELISQEAGDLFASNYKEKAD